MSDLSLKQLSNGCFDLDFNGLDLGLTDTLENAVIISIGSYARKKRGTAANLEPDIGGWWGDSLDENSIKLGGYIHEAFHEKLSDSTCRDIEKFIKDALKWMISDGVAKETLCSAEISDEKTISISIEIVKPAGNSEAYIYQFNWEETLQNGI